MPIFLPRKPDTQPLVVCFCDPVNATISALVAPPLAFFPSLRLRGRCFGLRGFRFGLGSFAQALNPLPDPAGSRLGVLELLHRLLARKAIQNRYRRSTGHWAASSANSCSVLKLSNGVAVAAAASSAVANALIAFSWSIVKVVIIVLLGAALCAVIT